MNLQKRTALVIATPLFILGIALYFIFDTILLQDFRKIEESRMRDNVQRVNGAMENTRQTLIAKTIDWAQWDDTYEFITDRNDKYIASILNYETLAALQMRHVVYVNTDKKVIESFKVLPEEEKVIPIPSGQLKAILNTTSLFQHDTVDNRVSGFLWLEDELVLIAAIPITDSKRVNPINGTLIFTQILSSDFIAAVGEQTRLDIAGIPLKDIKFSDTIDSIGYELALSNQDIGILAPDEITIFGFGLIHDVNNTPAMLLKTQQARDIYQQGLGSRNFLLVFIFIAILLVMISMFVFINMNILSRLALLTKELRAISMSKNTNSKVTHLGHDELGLLTSDINDMLETLNRSKSEIEKAKDIANAANAAKSMFIARVSHELRTPVGGIIGINRIIKKQDGLTRATRELIELGDSAAHGLLAIIDEILDFAKAESGELTFEKIPFDIRTVARETMAVISGRLEGKYKPEEKERVQLIFDIDPEIPAELIGDPTKLKQILINLLGNSIKFTSSGYVGLKATINKRGSQDPLLKFEVYDTGIGIPADKIDSVFESFKQVDESVTRKYQGTGLGLCIVKQFVEGLGGDIKVESTLGEGSTFSVSMPFKLSAESNGVEQRYKQASYPKDLIIVSEKSIATSTILNNLFKFGCSVKHFDIDEKTDEDLLNTKYHNADLIVFSEGALKKIALNKILEKRLSSKIGTSIVILQPSSLVLKDQLYAKGLEHALTTPVLADDIILAYQGSINRKPAVASPVFDPLKGHGKLKILIADDTPMNIMILEDMLADAGHDVVSVTDGQALLDKLTPMIMGRADAERFDIVFTDVSMPIMDGDAATRAIRALEKEQGNKIHLPIVAVTAHAMKEEQQRIKEAGVDGVLIKPLYPETVADIFNKLV